MEWEWQQLYLSMGNKAMKIADVDGVKIAGVLFEAGEKRVRYIA